MQEKRRILIVDDDDKMREVIERFAIFAGFEVFHAKNGIQAINFCRENKCDIVTMDIVMPNLDGFIACREIRKFSDVPIIMVSSRSDNFDQIHGYEVGIDDYMIKPISPKILFLKIEAILRRTNRSVENHDKIAVDGGLVIDFTSRKVTIDGEEKNLSPKLYDILFYLIKNRGVVVKKRYLIERVWGKSLNGDERTVDTHIRLLRKALGEYGEKIKTLRGIGYRFDV